MILSLFFFVRDSMAIFFLKTFLPSILSCNQHVSSHTFFFWPTSSSCIIIQRDWERERETHREKGSKSDSKRLYFFPIAISLFPPCGIWITEGKREKAYFSCAKSTNVRGQFALLFFSWVVSRRRKLRWHHTRFSLSFDTIHMHVLQLQKLRGVQQSQTEHFAKVITTSTFVWGKFGQNSWSSPWSMN